MHSLPRRISLFAFMIVVAAICLVCGIYKFWVFPPMLRVDVPSANQVVVDGNVLTLLDAEAVIAKYAKQQRDGSKKAFMKITVNENLAAPQRSALADTVLQQASAQQYDHCAVQFSDLDYLIR